MKLDRELERELWRQYSENREIEYRNKLIVFYEPFVKIEVSKLVPHYSKYVDYDDLRSYGSLGLIDAVEKFDIKKGVKFETYASIRIRGFILDQLRKQDWLPSGLRYKVKQVSLAYNELEAMHGCTPSEEEVAEYMNFSVSEVKNLLGVSHTAAIVSFEDAVLNMLKQEPALEYNPEHSLEKKFVKEALVQTIDELPEKERMVISLYYYEELTLKEIGKVLGVSESRVSQIHTKILNKLRLMLSNILEAV